MAIPAPYENFPAHVIRSLLQHTYVLSVYAKDMPYPLETDVAELNISTGRFVLDVGYAEWDIEQCLSSGCLSFDLEALSGPQATEREAYSLSNVAAKLLKTDSALYRLECQLPESFVVQENGGRFAFPSCSACMPASTSKHTCMSSMYRAGPATPLGETGLTGIDELDWCALVTPGITTLAEPNDAIGRAAVACLTPSHDAGSTRALRRHAPEWIIRGSTQRDAP